MNQCPPNKTQLVWNRKMIEMFIKLFKENECLYDSNHENYNNHLERMTAWDTILQKMQGYLPSLQIKDVQDKIKAIRVQLSTEISLVSASEAVGETYMPKLWCYDQVQFLRNHILNFDTDSNDVKSIHRGSNKIYNEDSDSDVSLFTELKRSERQKYIWSREMLKKYLKLYKRHKVLYYSKYKDNYKIKAEAFNKLLNEIRKIDPKIDLIDIRRKTHYLRNKYANEARCIKKAQENNETYTPKWWLFKRMANLYKCNLKVDSKTKTETIDDSSVNTNVQLEETLNNNTSDSDVIEDHLEDHLEEESVAVECVDMGAHSENLENELDYEIENSFIAEQENLNSTTNLLKSNKTENLFQKETITETIQPSFSTNSKNKTEGTNYEWLGDLVVSQLEEIQHKYHSEIAWDVQCLIRKYLLKSKTNHEKSAAEFSSGAKSCENSHDALSLPHNIAL